MSDAAIMNGEPDRLATQVPLQRVDLFDAVDSVYFFMWPGWRNELESNRWHWSKRWSQHLPVVLVQPELPDGVAVRSEAEMRLPNAEILSVEVAPRHLGKILAGGLRQSGQIAKHMAHRRHHRPLFWFYNPYLVVSYAVLPATLRVFHATENFFQLDNLSSGWLDYCRYAIEASNLLVCCSSGVAAHLSRSTRQKNIVTVPNGCEFGKYSQPRAPLGDWLAKLAKWQISYPRSVVFAGNINYRLDFSVIERVTDGYSQLGFVFAGPLDENYLSAVQRTTWGRLINKQNVHVLGRMPAEDLPALYARCDVGIIPYRTDLPVVVDNGFPLKALEMAAAGLPVISSYMKPLTEVASAITVTDNGEAFYSALASHSRATRTESERREAEQICKAYDYDVLFERMTEALAAVIPNRPCGPADLGELVGLLGAPIPIRRRFGELLAQISPDIKQKAPLALRRLARRWFR